MPDLDLEPKEVREQNPKTGEWRVRVSKRWARNWSFVGIAFLAVLFFIRADGSTSTFLSAVIIAIPTGMALALWLKDVD